MVGLPVHSLHNYQTFFSLKKRILSLSVLGAAAPHRDSPQPSPAHRDSLGAHGDTREGHTQPLPCRGYWGDPLPRPG